MGHFMQVAEVFLSGAAFALSILAIHLTSKRAEIHIVIAPNAYPALRHGGLSGAEIRTPTADTQLLAYNLGGRGGALTSMEVTAFNEPTGLLRPSVSLEEFIGVEGSSSKPVSATIKMSVTHTFVLGQGQTESYKALVDKLKALENVPVTIRYTYVTGRSRLPWKNQPIAKSDSLDLQIDIGHFRRKCLEFFEKRVPSTGS